ncbi:MAG: hypothetical protein QXV17_12985 [Candidatus Micrarchaeaceae archaeon]
MEQTKNFFIVGVMDISRIPLNELERKLFNFGDGFIDANPPDSEHQEIHFNVLSYTTIKLIENDVVKWTMVK